MAKEVQAKTNRQITEWEQTFTFNISDKGLYPGPIKYSQRSI